MKPVEGEVVEDGGKKKRSYKKELLINLTQKYWFWVVLVILLFLSLIFFIISGTVFFYERLIFILFKTPWNSALIAVAGIWIVTGVFEKECKKYIGTDFWRVRRMVLLLVGILTFMYYGFFNGLLFLSTIFIVTSLIKSLFSPRRLVRK
jgi:hypothetical protein